MTNTDVRPAAPAAYVARPRANPDRIRKLPEGALRPANAVSGSWVVVLPEGYTVEDALQPAFWANVARLLERRFHYFIDILNDEHSLYARLYVRAVQENQLIVSQIGKTQTFGPDTETFGPSPINKGGALAAKWNVGKRGYDVVRVADGQIVQDGSKFGVKEQALAWIDNHMKAMAA